MMPVLNTEELPVRVYTDMVLSDKSDSDLSHLKSIRQADDFRNDNTYETSCSSDRYFANQQDFSNLIWDLILLKQQSEQLTFQAQRMESTPKDVRICS